MSDKEKTILSEIDAFKRKKIINLSLKGLIFTLSILLSLFIVFSTLEFTFRFGINVRTVLFFSFLIISFGLLIQFIVRPLTNLLKLDHAIDDEKAASEIGIFFPEISDKLLNIIQLRNNNADVQSLAYAGIHQKINELPPIHFDDAVVLSENRKFLVWLAVPIAILLVLFGVKPDIITKSTERITNYNKSFLPEAPFTFSLTSESLQAFKNEDFKLQVSLAGQNIPQTVYVNDGGRKLKMLEEGQGNFTYLFSKIQSSKQVQFQAAGFSSSLYDITVLTRPDLKTFNMYLEFPKYLKKKNERLSNVGNARVPEGTNVRWQVNTTETSTAYIKFEGKEELLKLQESDKQIFETSQVIKNPDNYELLLTNEVSENRDPIKYKIDVLKDQYPKINNTVYQDTTLFSFIGLGGSISDDHGLTRLKLYYSFGDNSYQSTNIPINTNQNNQRYYYNWKIDSLASQGQNLKYYLMVWDNDGFNGNKPTKTGVYSFKIPTEKEIKESVDKTTEQTKTDLDKTLNEAKELKEELEEAERKIKGKKELNWQDDRLIKDLIKRREQLNEAINELKEQNRNNESKRERFTPQDEKLSKKVEQLQDLMDELLDEETKKLYDELKKLLDEESSVEEIQDLIEKINNKETNLEQELERTLELFKKMKFEFELNEIVTDLKSQIEDQESLMRETERTKDKGDQKNDAQQDLDKENKYEENELENDYSNSLSEKQQALQEKFEDLEEDLEDLNQQNQSLKNPESIPDTQEERQDIKNNQQESKESLDKNSKSKSKKSQEKARDAMQKMAEKMEQMQAGMEMQAMEENLEDLRAIVHNLLQLSFDQENLMNEFSEVKQSDPKFIDLSQKQLKLKDDSQIVQDSLLALAQRVFQIASFVTREVTEMNSRMDKSVEYIKERRKPQAVAEQQFAMTSINNLALLLDDVLEQMQNAMADAMGKPQKNKGKQKTPSLSELQQQLNNQIEDLKGSGKKGRQLSEELAKLAAEQERIRKALEEAQNQAGMKDGGNKPGGNIGKKMEESENDLVNKQLTEELINRQKQILTRLLESEDAMRERDLDEQRKGETANTYEKTLPNAFEEYFKLKEQEIELLKTIPPKLYPYYKNEVNEYFKRIESESSNIKPE